MIFHHKSLILFDLDGTLAESKQPLDEEMAHLLITLQDSYRVGIISGCNLEQMESQVVDHLFLHSQSHFLTLYQDPAYLSMYLLPTSGASGFTLHDDKPLWENKLSLTQKAMAYNIFWNVVGTREGPEVPFTVGCGSNDCIGEDRDSQITFSCCGQKATLEEKTLWNKEYGKYRHEIIKHMNDKLFKYDLQARIGGSTSIDVNLIGINKAYGATKLLQHEGFHVNETIFFGDQLQVGGNDNPVTTTGIKCIPVKNVEETKKILKENV